MRFTIGDIAESVKGNILLGSPMAQIVGFSIDSRTIKPGEMFIAVKGYNFDGHDFINDAIANGAAGIILSRSENINYHSNDNYIAVDSTVNALKDIASLIRKNFDIPFICITGTNGKTTVKEFLRHILSEKFNVLSSKRSFNNIFGVALTLFELTKDHEVAVFEVGTNSPGEIPELAEILQPDVGIITNIGYGHIEAFKDLEGVFMEKVALFEQLKENGLAIINKDDELLSRFIAGKYRTRYFGSNNGSDYFISGVSRNKKGYKFLINGQEYSLPFYGVHNVYNAAAAISAADYLGIDDLSISRALEKCSLPDMRLSRVMSDNVLFINDAYNANPSSFFCALNSIKYDVTAPKKGVIAGDMLELGDRSKELHFSVGKRIAELGIDFFIGLGEGAFIMIDAAVESGMPVDRTKKVKTHEEAALVLRQFADKESAVLLKGSRKSRMEDVVTCFTNYIMN